MITKKIEMPLASLYSGESFKCEKTGIELIKYTPIADIRALHTEYKVNDGTRDYVVPEQIFNIIKNLMT